MLLRILLPGLLFFVSGCKDKTPANDGEISPLPQIEQKEEVKQGFFPVNDFLRGEIAGLRTQGINPIVYTITGDKKDSAWLKSENFETRFAPFLVPAIDSSTLSGMFKETSFLDQTINAVTFSYDPKSVVPDSLSIKRWDVYIDPDTEKVRRIYILKKLASGHIQQLTWQVNHGAKIVELDPAKTGNSAIVSETEIKWDY